jgi:hypothetical protein
MGHLSTHVLDTANGRPAAGMRVTLQRLDGAQAHTLREVTLNEDGRSDGGPLLDAAAMAVGRYRLLFDVAGYSPTCSTGPTCCCAGLHVITAIAWIGSSFYFVWLDNSLTPAEGPDLKAKGVDGELWAVHGGGFYNPQKYMVAPRQDATPNLHWFYWESYSTWLTGFALFTVLYLFNAGSFLVDKTVFDWSPAAAVAAALGFLVAFWLVYDPSAAPSARRRTAT